MAQLSDFVEVEITANTQTPTRQGFGVPLVLSYHTRFADTRRRYSDLDEMVADGFLTTDPAHRMAQAIFSQEDRPEEIVVGRLPAAHTHTQTITILDATEGNHIKFSVLPPGSNTPVEIDYTILAAATTTTVATAVELLVEAITGVDASSAGAVITVTPTTPGNMVYIRNLELCAIRDTTADANYDDALTALRLVDDDWYFILLDVNSEANVDLVAAWVQTRVKLFIAQTQDTGEKEGTGTLLTGLQALSYDRTASLFVEALSEYGAPSWVGAVGAKNPGSATWKFKQLVGVTPSTLTTTQENNLKNAGGNFITRVAGFNVTTEGWTADGEFIDIRHGTDWLTARIQERIFGVLVNAAKIPFSDASGDLFVGEVLSVLGEAADADHLFLLPTSLTASATKVADMNPADRAERLFRYIKFGGDFASAVHKVGVKGTLTV